jgi:4-amino-4-deoxychorismate lyase
MALIINGVSASVDQKLYSTFHGHSVFTTLRSKKGSLVFWPEHWLRLSTHAQYFDFSLPKEDQILDVIEPYLLQSEQDQKIRIIIGAQGYGVTLEDLSPPDQGIYEGVKIILSSMQVHPQLARFKTANYLPYSLALKEALKAGAFEALLTNSDGFVVDGSRTSLMLFKGNKLVLLEGGLVGVMREKAAAFAESCGLSVAREMLGFKDLDGQLLLANSLIGVVAVGSPLHPFVIKLIEYFRP